MKKYLSIITIILLLSLNLAAQVTREPEISMIKTNKGMAVFSRVPPQPFSFLVAGKNPQSSQNSDGGFRISTDEDGLYFYFVKTSDFLDAKRQYKTSEILTIQRQNDIAAQEKSLKKELHVNTTGEGKVTVDDLRKGLNEKAELETVYWSYQLPVGENRVLYQSVVLGDLVLMIGTAFDSSVKVEDIRSIFTRTLESITLLPPPQPKITPKKQTTQGKYKRNKRKP